MNGHLDGAQQAAIFVESSFFNWIKPIERDAIQRNFNNCVCVHSTCIASSINRLYCLAWNSVIGGSAHNPVSALETTGNRPVSTGGKNAVSIHKSTAIQKSKKEQIDGFAEMSLVKV